MPMKQLRTSFSRLSTVSTPIASRSVANVAPPREVDKPHVVSNRYNRRSTKITVKLPQELIDMIIDHLHTDKPSLAACSLVCKAWLPSSRYHILSHVLLHPMNVNTFLEILNPPSPSVILFLRKLELQFRYFSFPDDVLPYLVVLTSIDSLSLDLFLWESLDADAKEALLSGFLSVTTLVLKSAILPTFAEAACLICSFPALEHLELLGSTWGKISVPDPTPHIIPYRLRTLVLSSSTNEDHFYWFISHAHVFPVTTLELHHIKEKDMFAISRYLQIIGPNITTLRVFYAYFQGWDVQGLRLGCFTQLRSIHIGPLSAYDESDIWWLIATRMISKVESPWVDDISFHLYLRSSDDLMLFDWSAMANCLPQLRFPSLRAIRFLLSMVHLTDEELMGWVRKKSTLSNKAGVVVFEWPVSVR